MEMIDIVPETGSFKLAATGNKYSLRPITLADEIWIKKTFGDKLMAIFSGPDFESIVKIVYHQLKEKGDFVEEIITDFDENGCEIKEKIGGYKRLAKLISGEGEKVNMIWALNETMGVSRPVDEPKKKPLAE